MRPSHLEPYGSQQNNTTQTWSQDISITQNQSQSQSQQSARRLRSEDSWVEIASRPSSTSLTSLDNREEIITTGLQVRRETGQPPQPSRTYILSRPVVGRTRSTSIAGSSQDEYEESESESDRMLSSSNEDVGNEAAEDGDDVSTTLGIDTSERNVFTPQPNAFSHPPDIRSVPSSGTDSYFTTTRPSTLRLPSNRVPNIQRPAMRERMTTSNVQPDHDAALRASLTTLLSCAAAVGKEKNDSTPMMTSRSTQPTTLRLIPASELDSPSPSPPRIAKTIHKRRSRESSKERQAKKIRPLKAQTTEDLVSPTLMTWFISAGVVLVFSAISFSAGYAWGKEAGRIEGQMGIESSSCGREALRGSRTGLSKLRLSSVRA